jgi:hypothetical protein
VTQQLVLNLLSILEPMILQVSQLDSRVPIQSTV